MFVIFDLVGVSLMFSIRRRSLYRADPVKFWRKLVEIAHEDNIISSKILAQFASVGVFAT